MSSRRRSLLILCCTALASAIFVLACGTNEAPPGAFLSGGTTGASAVPADPASPTPDGTGQAIPDEADVAEQRAPLVTSITPNSIALGLIPAEGLEVRIAGLHFARGATIQVGDYLLSSTFASASEVRVRLDADRIRAVGDYRISVTNPSGLASNAFSFTLVPPTRSTIARLAPTVGTAFAADPVTVELAGTGFIEASRVRFDGELLATTFGAPTRLSFVVPPALLTKPGTHAVTIANGTEVVSDAAAFDVLYARPTIGSFEPPALPVNTGVVQVTVRGTGFTPATVYTQLILPALETTFVSPTEIRVPINTNIGTPGPRSVALTNPAPGGGTTDFVDYPIR